MAGGGLRPWSALLPFALLDAFLVGLVTGILLVGLWCDLRPAHRAGCPRVVTVSRGTQTLVTYTAVRGNARPRFLLCQDYSD